MHRLPLLTLDTEVAYQEMQGLRPIIAALLGSLNPQLRLLGALGLQMHLRNHIVAVPHLLPPAAERNPLLVELNRFFCIAETLVGLCQIEMRTNIGWLFGELAEQKALVSHKFVRFATTVVFVVNPQL